jgi:hypothetical protein
MKTLRLTTICLLSVVLFHCHSGRNKSTVVSDENTSVEISENENLYKLEASFEKNKVMDVYRYINSSLEPQSLFTSEDDRVDVSMTLGDGTTFRIKAYGGELSLAFDKRSNSRESYKRIKELCDGVKEVVM